MKLTKQTHAHLVLEQEGQKLIIDPGSFTKELGDITDVAAVVVTHSHPDHFNEAHLAAIHQVNPDASLFTTAEVAEKISWATVVKAGDQYDIGAFHLDFYGDQHAAIHASVPVPHNIGVVANGDLYYPGDSFTNPLAPVHTLAVPGNAPWARVGEAMDFIHIIGAGRVFPTHDGLLNDGGHTVYNSALKSATEASGGVFSYLQPGESIDL
jgi:L-ascorbate metabolism protein UlaG (beta-lactamase superfamily)